jgi:biotin carboxylase
MNKRHVLIFAKTSRTRTPYDEWLAGSGIEPIILATDECAASYRHLPEVYSFANYDHNQLVEKTAFELARSHSLVGIFARGEPDVIRAAQLRELLDLPGQKTASALAFRNKVIMKDHLRGSGVRVPEYRAVDSAYRVIQFVEQHGYPVIIKPSYGSGSYGTNVIRDAAELDRYLAQAPRTDMEIESFVDGPMYHVDGLILDGELVFISPFRYVNDCLSYRKSEFLGFHTVGAADPLYQRLVSNAREVVATLPSPRHMAFHCELWHTPDDQIVFCEIASRTGGALISSTIKHGFGFQIDKEWFYAECGLARTLPSQLSYQPAGAVLLPPLDGILEHIPNGNEPPYVREAEIPGVVGQRYHGGVKSGFFVAGYVVAGSSETDVARHISETAAWFTQHARWQIAGP